MNFYEHFWKDRPWGEKQMTRFLWASVCLCCCDPCQMFAWLHTTTFVAAQSHDLFVFPPEGWKRPPGRPCITWLDCTEWPETPQPCSDWGTSEPPSLEAVGHVRFYALWCCKPKLMLMMNHTISRHYGLLMFVFLFFFGRSLRCCTILSSYLYSYDMVIVDSAALVLLKFQWLTFWGFSV